MNTLFNLQYLKWIVIFTILLGCNSFSNATFDKENIKKVVIRVLPDEGEYIVTDSAVLSCLIDEWLNRNRPEMVKFWALIEVQIFEDGKLSDKIQVGTRSFRWNGKTYMLEGTFQQGCLRCGINYHTNFEQLILNAERKRKNRVESLLNEAIGVRPRQ